MSETGVDGSKFRISRRKFLHGVAIAGTSAFVGAVAGAELQQQAHQQQEVEAAQQNREATIHSVERSFLGEPYKAAFNLLAQEELSPETRKILEEHEGLRTFMETMAEFGNLIAYHVVHGKDIPGTSLKELPGGREAYVSAAVDAFRQQMQGIFASPTPEQGLPPATPPELPPLSTTF